MPIVCRSPTELEKMRRSGHAVREVLDTVKALVRPGVTTMDLERAADQKIRDLGGVPAFKGYQDYPCVLCTSVNQEIVHGIPSERRALKEGDIVSIDCGVVLDGYYGDAAITVPVGAVKPELQKLLEVTEQSLYKGIEKMRIGNTVQDVGSAVQDWVEKHGFSVVREFVGHGIGTRRPIPITARNTADLALDSKLSKSPKCIATVRNTDANKSPPTTIRTAPR